MNIEQIVEEMKYFEPERQNDSLKIIIPVVIHIAGGLLELRISPAENGYKISNTLDYYDLDEIIFTNGNIFYDFNEEAAYYVNLFENNEKHYHFDIRYDYEKEEFSKTYPDNFNINVALSEFAKFFIYLDDYIKENNLT